MLPKRAFVFDAELEAYRCPEGQIIPYATTDRTGYRHYKSDATTAQNIKKIAMAGWNARPRTA